MSSQIVHLNIGELLVGGAPHVFSTVLGSCVSVALFSPDTGWGGLIHYALPDLPKGLDPESLEALRYGEAAIPVLVNSLMQQTGLPASRFVAKIVGGASGLSDARHNVGPENIRRADSSLKQFGIKVIGRDVGGARGRKILFHPGNGRLQVALLEKENIVHIEAPVIPMPSAPVKVAPLASSRPAKPLTVAKTPARKRRVLVIDDSKTIRDLLARVLNATEDLEVVGTAENPLVAEKMIDKVRPDVITLDVHMPEMDGLTYLSQLIPKRPLPVVMITSISMQDGDTILRALEMGAVDYIQKPNLQELQAMTPLIQEKVRSASYARVQSVSRARLITPAPGVMTGGGYPPGTVLAIGASTGGTEAIRAVLTELPAEIPPIVIVQHIPPVFSTAFAQRLNSLCPFEVREAQNGDALQPGLVLVAPGGMQMGLRSISGQLKVVVNDDPPMTRHKPSVDYLFQDVAKVVGPKAVGVILTGMGGDGAQGLLKMKQAGARTLGQDEASSVVYGMPKVAFDLGAVDKVCSLSDMPHMIMKTLKQKNAA